MKNFPISTYIRYNIFLIIVLFCICSCSKSDKPYNNFPLKINSSKEKPIIDFSEIDCLNESNQKILELSDTSIRLTKDLKTLKLALKIRKDHQQIDSRLNKLTKENLIVIPKIFYNVTRNSDFTKNKNSDQYIFRKLKAEIIYQIALLDSIEKNTQNIDFKIFAAQSKKTLIENGDAIKKLLNS